MIRVRSAALAGILTALLATGYSWPTLGSRAPAETGKYEEREPIPSEIFIPTAGKRLACFMTINSVEEKATFTKNLNPAEWDLVEFVGTTPGAPTSGWIDAICKSGIQCDLEVISGHFAGNFFGKSGMILSLEEMNNHSCAADCSGVLNHPREVYLFGCNTLAGKDHDSRTPQEYFDILVADGIPRDQAARIVEDRYSPFGQDNRGKMQRSFSGVPYLYGFYSKGPLGADIEPILKKYFQQLGDYTAHFDQIAKNGMNATKNPNLVIGGLLAGKNFYQIPGLDPGSDEYEANRPICALSDGRTPIGDRVDVAIHLLNGDRMISFLPSLETFFRLNYRQIRDQAADKFRSIQKLEKPRAMLLASIDTVFLFATKLKWVRFAREIGWLDDAALDTRLQDLVAKKFAETPIAADIGTAVCDVGYHGFLGLDFTAVLSVLRADHWTTRSAVRAMGCAGLARYPKFKAALLARLASRSTRTKDDTYALASLFGSFAVKAPDADDRALLGELVRACRDVPDATSAELCPPALANLAPSDPAARDLALALLASAPPRLQGDLAPAFIGFEDPNLRIESAFADLALNLPLPFAYGAERYFDSRPAVDPAARRRLWDRIRDPGTGARRTTGLLSAVRNASIDPTELSVVLAAARSRGLLETGERLLLAELRLFARNGGSDAQLLDAFRENRYAVLTYGPLTADLYAELDTPRLKAHFRKVPESASLLCDFFAKSAETSNYDGFGEATPRSVPARKCGEFLR